MKNKRKLLVEFGNAVRARRRDLGLSQEQFAHICSLDRTYISGVERGIRNVSLVNISSIATALGITIAELLHDLEKK